MANESTVWEKLWAIATGEAAGPARIDVDPEDIGRVLLMYPDGSRAALYWHAGDWQYEEPLSSAPCDVAARDSI